ncbi:MAG: hypothetical protein GW936_06040 [Gallionella sp.]|nr:hypothetical protein [Gallionella sp.]
MASFIFRGGIIAMPVKEAWIIAFADTRAAYHPAFGTVLQFARRQYPSRIVDD